MSASSSSSTAPMERPRQRRRPAFSCLECRRRKIKCDRKDPCSHCVSVAIQCVHKVFRDAPETSSVQNRTQSRTAPPSPVSSSSSRAQSGQSRTHEIVNETGSAVSRSLVAGAELLQSTPAPIHAAHTEAATAQIPLAARDEDEQLSLHALLRRIQHLENSLSTNPVPAHSEPGDELSDRQPVHQDTRVSLYKTRISKWSYWVGMVDEV